MGGNVHSSEVVVETDDMKVAVSPADNTAEASAPADGSAQSAETTDSAPAETGDANTKE